MEQQLTPFEAMEMALEITGSQSALARICGVSQTAVWKWLQSSKRLPAEYVLVVERATGVSRHLLRPDIYPLQHGMRLPFWRPHRRRYPTNSTPSRVSRLRSAV